MESKKGDDQAADEMEHRRQPCWKKKEPDAGFLSNAKDHLHQFVNTSMDQHRICLKKTIRGVEDYIKLKRQNKLLSSSAAAAADAEAISVVAKEEDPPVVTPQ